MTSLSQIWLCGLSEVIRADHVTSLFVADGTGRGRASESNGEGVLWAHVVGRAEPARIEGFTGITAAEVLDAVTRTIARAFAGNDPVVFIRLHSTGDRVPVTAVTESTTFHSP